jgi:uncharacterized protein YbbK (DUF523 family)/uncharacterized protein YbgA (DUF1722 family)
MNFIKPKIVVSKCLEFDACRYDGQLITNKYIKMLKEFIDFIPVCPEVEIGLGTPRDTIKVVNNKDGKILFQPSTNTDLTKKMKTFSDGFLGQLENVEGFILKSKSPSCGLKSAKMYVSKNNSPSMGAGDGLFAEQVRNRFPDFPSEDEKRLNNVFIREHFYTTIFTIADFRGVDNMKKMYEYHSKHKYLFMSYNQALAIKMGRIAANSSGDKFEKVRSEYFQELLIMFKKRARYTSNINMLMHVMGYFKSDVTSNEKKHFLSLLETYRQKKIPLSALTSVLFSWATRFNNRYLLNQSLFSSFPMELMGQAKSRFL